jgi:hypothetical protein
MKDETLTTDIWQLYEKGVSFNRKRSIYSDTDTNFRMYNGNQWEGLPTSGGIEPVVFNIIKPIVKYKVGTINANLWSINYSAENFDNGEFRKTAEKVCENLNKHAARIWEKDNMDTKIRDVSKKACINSEGIIYVNYEEDEPVNELINKTDIYYGNENSEDIQSQPYIIIKTRKPVEQIREFAILKGVDETEARNIISDNITSEESGEQSKLEVNDMGIILTKLYKKEGKVYYSKSTKTVDIEKDIDSGLTLYPVAHFVWESEEGSSRGAGEVKPITANQIEINRTATRRSLAVKLGAYPKMIVNTDKITNPSDVDKIGVVLKAKGIEVDDVRKIVNFTIPAQISSDSEKLQSELIEKTRELNGAGDITTGTVNPEQASGRAILAVQQASALPLTEQTSRLKTFIEDIARIWLEMWKVYSKEGKTILEEQEQLNQETGEVETIEVPVTIPATVLEQLKASVRVDITPKSSFDKYAVEQSLENLFTSKFISFEEYVKSLPEDSVMPKTTLQEIVEDRKQAQQEIAQLKVEADKMQSEYDNILNEADIQNAEGMQMPEEQDM